MKLIGIAGLKTSGKDTTFNILKQLAEGRGETAIRRAFADQLKISAALALGYGGDDAELIQQMDLLKDQGYVDSALDSGVGNHLTGREFLQNYGAKFRDVFGEDFWVDQVVPWDKSKLNFIWWGSPDWGCVTDVRYPNEAYRILASGGEIWQIYRPGLESDGHSSEISLPEHLRSRRIMNDGHLSELKYKVIDAMEETANAK